MPHEDHHLLRSHSHAARLDAARNRWRCVDRRVVRRTALSAVDRLRLATARRPAGTPVAPRPCSPNISQRSARGSICRWRRRARRSSAPCGTRSPPSRTARRSPIATSLRAQDGPASIRAAGAATGRNPLSIFIPCHRIVGADGTLTGYAGGLDRKRALLALERGERAGAIAAPRRLTCGNPTSRGSSALAAIWGGSFIFIRVLAPDARADRHRGIARADRRRRARRSIAAATGFHADAAALLAPVPRASASSIRRCRSCSTRSPRCTFRRRTR